MTEAVVHTSNPWVQEFLLGLESNNVLLSFLAVGWVITESDQGDNALAMTDAPELFELIHESFSKDGDMPTVHAPDDTTLPSIPCRYSGPRPTTCQTACGPMR